MRCIYVYLRYRRNKKHRSAKQQNGHITREFENDTFSSDYSNTGKFTSEAEIDTLKSGIKARFTEPFPSFVPNKHTLYILILRLSFIDVK